MISRNFVPLLDALYNAEDQKQFMSRLRSLATNHPLSLSRERKWLSKGFVKEINLNHCSYKIYEALTKKCQAWITASKASIISSHWNVTNSKWGKFFRKCRKTLRSILPQQRENIIRIANTVLIHLKKNILLSMWITLKDINQQVN